jgi:hypothetical protein
MRTDGVAPWGAETDRVEAFSDGVLAIVITLPVLEIAPPSVQGGLLPAIGAWVVSSLLGPDHPQASEINGRRACGAIERGRKRR